MRGIFGRGWRLELAAGLGLALVLPMVAAAAENAAAQPSQTTLSIETRDNAGRTRAALALSVTGEDGSPANGAIAIEDEGRQIAATVLDAEGRATFALDLGAGDHDLRAVYLGDKSHHGSQSVDARVHAEAGSTPDFSIGVSPATLTLQVGQSGSVAALLKPENNASLSAPMFVTLSCQGLPDEAACTFTPENLEILPSSCPDPSASSCPLKSTMVIATQLGSGQLIDHMHRSDNPLFLAILVPGGLALIGLGWKRRKGWASLSMMALVGMVTVLGATACNPRYNYFHHGPPPIPATPTGTYKLTISAQSNNGITATTHSTTMVLTVE